MPAHARLPLPWWADPANASVTDSLPTTMARKAVGLLGLDDPTTAVNSMINPMSAVGEGTGGLISSLMRLRKTPAPTAALAEHLSTLSPEATISPNVGGVMGGRVPTPTRFGDMFNRMLGRVPEAAGKLEPLSSEVRRAPGLPTIYQNQAAFRGKEAGTPESRLMKDMLKGIYDRPSVTSLDQLGDVTMQPKLDLPSNSGAVLSSKAANGPANARTAATLARSGLSEDQIRAIRAMSLDDAIKQFPTVGKGTLDGIVRGDTFGWIK